LDDRQNVRILELERMMVVTKQIRSKNQQRGYSIVELLVSLVLIGIFSALAVPSLLGTYRSYQMDDVASQVAAQIKFTRYEAIRRNSPINCLNSPQSAQGGLLTIYAQDPKAPNANVQTNEKQMVFAANAIATLAAAAAVPNSSSLATLVNAGTLTTVSPTSGTITFDGRGAKTAPAGGSVYWVGNAAYGWRAVTVLPSGSVQVWSSATGTWKQLS
jgi:prepilin-type N-terminal cleavage/methylation domain-containing protein